MGSLDAVSDLTSLTVLYLRNTQVMVSLDMVVSLTRLTRLDLSSTSVSGASLDALALMPGLLLANLSFALSATELVISLPTVRFLDLSELLGPQEHRSCEEPNKPGRFDSHYVRLSVSRHCPLNHCHPGAMRARPPSSLDMSWCAGASVAGGFGCVVQHSLWVSLLLPFPAASRAVHRLGCQAG